MLGRALSARKTGLPWLAVKRVATLNICVRPLGASILLGGLLVVMWLLRSTIS